MVKLNSMSNKIYIPHNIEKLIKQSLEKENEKKAAIYFLNKIKKPYNNEIFTKKKYTGLTSGYRKKR